MAWKRILVGIDDSAESLAAAVLAWRLAQALEAECVPVHAAREFWIPFAEEEVIDRVAELQLAVIDAARSRLAAGLQPHVPEEMIKRMIVRFGRAAVVLRGVAQETGAEAIVLGGKHHSRLDRWVGGSTSHDVVRSAGLPVIVAAHRTERPFRRVLAAVDLSGTAGAIAAAALDIAGALGAELRAVSVLEPPVPLPAITPPLAQPEYQRMAEEALRRHVWPLFESRPVATLARSGEVLETILREATAWGADLVVVGSHGKGWAERLLLGSVTERLLDNLPASLLVVPIGAPSRQAEPVPRARSTRSRGRRPARTRA